MTKKTLLLPWVLLLFFTASVLADPLIVKASEWGSQPSVFPDSMKQVPQTIVIHHAGVSWPVNSDPAKKLRDLQTWGKREKGWLDLPYHYLITPEGGIYEGRDWRYQPDSNTKYPLQGILNVQLFGDFDTDLVSRQQLESLVELLAFVYQQHRLDPRDLSFHREQAPGQTTCPGKDLVRYVEGPLPSWILRHQRNQPNHLDFWFKPAPIGAN